MDTIIVIRLGRLGDVTLTGPTIKNLRFQYPASRIIFVTRKGYAPIIDMLPGCDEVLTFPADGAYFDLVKLSSAIDDHEPRLIVDLHKNFRSFHLANMTKAPYKVVYNKRRKERQAAVHDKKFVSPIPHTVDLYNLVIDRLKGEKIARRPDLNLDEKILSGAGSGREMVAIAPGASSPVKAWPIDRFAELAERIHFDFKLPIGLFLGPDDGKLQEAFASVPENALTVYHNQPLPDIAGLMACSRFTITNDSGLMHISSAVGTPTIALFGPTHEQLGFYPLGLHDVILATDEKCRPCSLHGNKPCYREDQYCFTRMSVDSIYNKIAGLIDRITLKPAVFIDRDGTLIKDKHYLADPEGISFLPGSLEAVRKLKEAGYLVVVVSNQSGVARGFYPVGIVEEVNDRLCALMHEAGCEPDDIRYCPHYLDGEVAEYSIDCNCRKPKPGMLEEAAATLGIDIKRSYMIGDKQSDILCGRAAGVQPVLVRSGKGAEAEKQLPDHPFMRPDFICDTLAEAVDFVLLEK